MITQKVMKIAVYKKGDSAYHGDSLTNVEIVDHGAGEFIEISQPLNDDVVQFESMQELTNVFEVACELLKTCEKEDEN